MKYMKFFQDNNNAFTAIGVILTFVVAIITLIATIHNNKSKQYIDTITRSRIEWIGHLRKLVAHYLSIVNIDLNTSTNTIASESNYREILNLSNEIQLMMNYKSNFDNKIIQLLSDITSMFDELRITNECINLCGGMLAQSAMDEDIACNPYFVKYLIRYAKENDHPVPDEFNYNYNCSSVVDLFTAIIKTPEDKDIFIQELFENPEKLVHHINLKCIDLANIIKIYLKSEWNRVKKESQGKKYSSKKQEKEIEKLSN